MEGPVTPLGLEEAAEDDFLRLVLADHRTANVNMKSVGLMHWPPPPYLVFSGRVLERTRHSALTRAQTDECPNVARGAEYVEIADKDRAATIMAAHQAPLETPGTPH